MRSYWSHLKTTSPEKEHAPIFRASAIFPVFQQSGVSSRILFLGYWMLKRGVSEIAAVITLRSEKGEKLARETLLIQEAKCYRVELSDYLENQDPFTGSLEVEFFSTKHLVFPFPAVVINYYGKHFSAVVHTAQRVYNNVEDMQKNSETNVPESGFNLHADEDYEPFIGLINGPVAVENSQMKIHFFNSDKETLSHKIPIKHLNPYETTILYPARLVDLGTFFKGKEGAAKLDFNVNWIFPRLVAGNLQKSTKEMSITHTYYDCQKADQESDYWRPIEDAWHAASLMIPLITKNNHFTKIYFYPIYSPAKIAISLEIYDLQGNLEKTVENALILSSPSKEFSCIDLQDLANDREGSLRIIANPVDSMTIPARIKVAFDIGTSSLPCNICTNLQPFNPPLESKPKTFRWFPLLTDAPNPSCWIMNSSPEKDFSKNAEIELTFYREKDTSTLKRQLKLPPHGSHKICLDDELEEFFDGQVGWVTAISTNPYTTTYYFSLPESGVVGGDHGF